jgi:hypothetical protein
MSGELINGSDQQFEEQKCREAVLRELENIKMTDDLKDSKKRFIDLRYD